MTTFMLTDKETDALLLQCDGCRQNAVVSLPMNAFEFAARLLAFDADHRFCLVRPIQCCQYVALTDGTCTHERNLTPECSLAICPLT
jgi:hypothetical protein